MKKTILILSLLLAITSQLCANNTVTKNYNFGNIKSIEASSIFAIEVTQGNAKGVRIECDEVYEKHLDIRCSQGELKLSLTHCPLAYILRKKLRKKGISKGFKVVFSEELPCRDAIVPMEERNKKSQVGTISYLPAVFGCVCAQAAIEHLIGKK